VSTSLALQRWNLQAKVMLFESSATETASKDINKVIRTPYLDEDISCLAEEAHERWKTTSLYQEHYRQTAWIRIISKNNNEWSLKSSSERIIFSSELLERVGLKGPHS
jgi:hypothetical protein